MNKEFNWDSIEGFQLKECYELAEQFENLDIARRVIREKRKNTHFPDNYIPVQPDAGHIETDMQIASEIMYSLTMDQSNPAEQKDAANYGKVSYIKNIGEREFLSALLALKKGTSETYRVEALRHLENAISDSPNDIRYITLINIIRSAGR